MKIREPSFKLINPPAYDAVVALLDAAGRNCYRSEPKGTPEQFIEKIVNSGHESVIEHVSITAKIICDRGVMAELTRHRLASFSIESTRYCNYGKGRFGSEIAVIRPSFFDPGSGNMATWKTAMETSEEAYMTLLESGAKPEEARSVLPNSLATTIFMSANLREWRHIFKLRCSKKAHPQCREVMVLGLSKMIDLYSVFFEDLAWGGV